MNWNYGAHLSIMHAFQWRAWLVLPTHQNSANLKLVMVLNNLGLDGIVANTFQTPMPRFVNWLVPSSNSLALNMSDELVKQLHKQKICLSMSTNNCSKIPSSFEEELELSPIKSEPWLEDEAISFKWEYFHKLYEKNKNVGGGFTYIVLAYKTKLMGLKQRSWTSLLH